MPTHTPYLSVISSPITLTMQCNSECWDYPSCTGVKLIKDRSTFLTLRPMQVKMHWYIGLTAAYNVVTCMLGGNFM